MRITSAQEAKIMRLLSTEQSARSIARQVGVAPGTVRRIRLAAAATAHWNDVTQSEVRTLLAAGLSAEAISARMEVPAAAIRAFIYLNCSTDDCRCRFCGAILTPNRGEPRPDSVPPAVFSTEDSVAMYHTVEAILQLHDAVMIPNPLFHHLAMQAERIIQKINGKENERRKSASGSLYRQPHHRLVRHPGGE